MKTDSSQDSKAAETERRETERSGPSMIGAFSPAQIADLRNKAARIVALGCTLFALILVGGALFIALGGNGHNDLAHWVKQTADSLDLGVFDRKNGVFRFENKRGKGEIVKNVTVNWGLAAVAWVFLGRVLAGLLRTSTPRT